MLLLYSFNFRLSIQQMTRHAVIFIICRLGVLPVRTVATHFGLIDRSGLGVLPVRTVATHCGLMDRSGLGVLPVRTVATHCRLMDRSGLGVPPVRAVATYCGLMDRSGLLSCKSHSEYTKSHGGTLGTRRGKSAVALSSVNIRTLPPVVWCVQRSAMVLTQGRAVSQLTADP
jgi:hypothetical protein